MGYGETADERKNVHAEVHTVGFGDGVDTPRYTPLDSGRGDFHTRLLVAFAAVIGQEP